MKINGESKYVLMDFATTFNGENVIARFYRLPNNNYGNLEDNQECLTGETVSLESFKTGIVDLNTVPVEDKQKFEDVFQSTCADVAVIFDKERNLTYTLLYDSQIVSMKCHNLGAILLKNINCDSKSKK